MIKRLFLQFFRNKNGGTAIEYGMIAALFAIACIGAVRATGGEMQTMYQRISDSVTAAVARGGGDAQTGGPGSAQDKPILGNGNSDNGNGNGNR